MSNTNMLHKNLFDLELYLSKVRFNNSITERLTKVLIKNYLDNIVLKDTTSQLMFAHQYDDIDALARAINEINCINKPILKKLETEYEKLYKEVK